MISKIISHAACLRELACNPKSFSNCPDLHGGAPDLPGVNRPKRKACIARLGFGRITCTSTTRFRKFRGTEFRVLERDSHFESSFANSNLKIFDQEISPLV